MSTKLSCDAVEDYRRLFFWYRYQFYIRSRSFQARFDNTEEGTEFKLLVEEESDFFYIARLVLDDLASFEDYPVPGWEAPEIHHGKGRPKKPAPETKPARKSSAALPWRDIKWENFILKESDLARKNPGGEKETGDFFWPFPLWEKSLLVYDLLECGLRRTEVGNRLNNKTLAEVLESAHLDGIRPIKYDLISRAYAHFSPLSHAIVGNIAAHPAKLSRSGADTYFTSPSPRRDQENLRRDRLAYVAEAHERAISLIRSSEKGTFPN